MRSFLSNHFIFLKDIHGCSGNSLREVAALDWAPGGWSGCACESAPSGLGDLGQSTLPLWVQLIKMLSVLPLLT